PESFLAAQPYGSVARPLPASSACALRSARFPQRSAQPASSPRRSIRELRSSAAQEPQTHGSAHSPPARAGKNPSCWSPVQTAKNWDAPPASALKLRIAPDAPRKRMLLRRVGQRHSLVHAPILLKARPDSAPPRLAAAGADAPASAGQSQSGSAAPGDSPARRMSAASPAENV